MSKSTAEHFLTRVLTDLNRASQKSEAKPKWTKHRVKEAENLSAYGVHSDIIYPDIKKEFSPFRKEFDLGIGDMPSDSLFREAADEISRDMWIRYKRQLFKVLPQSRIFRVKAGQLPRDFYLKADEPKGAFDEEKRIVYYNGGFKSKNNFEKFQAQIKRPVEKQIKALSDDNKAKQYLSPTATYGGLNVGHTEGSSTTILGGLIANRDEMVGQGAGVQLIDLGSLGDKRVEKLGKEFKGQTETNSEAIKRFVTSIIEGDANLVIERNFNPKDPNTKISFTMPESAIHNKSSGGSAGVATKLLRQVLKNLGQDLFDLGGSPDHIQLLRKQIETLFLGKKPRTFKSRTRASLKGPKRSIVTTLRVPVSSKVRVVKRGKAKKGKPVDLSKLIAFLNRKLHDKIRQNMGKGGSRTTLNYRTGRFARSAKILALYPAHEKGAIIAEVKYMRRPYGVFEIGGKLNPPKMRDPAGIFGRSIRQLLQEEAIANLRRVKVTLRG